MNCYFHACPYRHQPLYYYPNTISPYYWNEFDDDMTSMEAQTLPINTRGNRKLPEPSSADYGNEPFVVNIHEEALNNNNFRTTIWTGDHLQVTVMNIPIGGDVGLETHPNVDQFLRIEKGEGLVQMGKSRDQLNFVRRVTDDSAIVVPVNTWHNITNIGTTPLKLYSIYAPPEHAFGTVHRTQADDLDK